MTAPGTDRKKEETEMKRKLWILLALTVLSVALCCGGAMAAEDGGAVNVFGIVNASTLPDDADLILTGDTTLVMDVEKRFCSVRGPYNLRIEGDDLLEVYTRSGHGAKHGIEVSSFYSSADFTITYSQYIRSGLYAQNDVTVENAFFRIFGDVYGIYSVNGNITLQCAGQRSHSVTYYPDRSFIVGGIYAENGSVNTTGALETTCQRTACIYAKGDIALRGQYEVETSRPLALEAGGNILLGGDCTIRANPDAYDTSDFSVSAPNGSIRILQGSTVTANTKYGFGAKSITMAHGALGLTSFQGTGLRATDGNITLNGTVYISSLDTAIICKNGTATINGNLTAQNRNEYVCISAEKGVSISGGTSTITSESVIALKSLGNISLGGKVTVNAGTSGTLPSSPYAVYSENGSVTVQSDSDITITGKYGIGANSFTMMGGRLGTNIQEGMAVRAFTGNISIMGTAILTSNDTVLYAPHGSIQVNGNLTAHNWNENIPIAADRDISLTGGTHIVTASENCQLALRSNGGITLGGTVTVRGGTEDNTTLRYTVLAETGALTVQSGTHVSIQGQYGLRAASLVMGGKSLTVEAAEGPGVLADNGITLENSLLAVLTPSGGTIDGSTIVDSSGQAASHVVIDRPDYYVTYNANGGGGYMIAEPVKLGDTYILPPCRYTPVEGWSFTGWRCGSSIMQPGETMEISGNVSAYAQWYRDEYVIRFDADGGTGSMANGYTPVGNKYTLPENGFTAPAGKQFYGWKIYSGVKGAGGTYLFLPGKEIEPIEDLSVTPHWLNQVPSEPCEVIISPGSGTGEAYTMSATVGLPFSVPQFNFTPPAHTHFFGWQITATLTGETVDYVNAVLVVPKGGLTITATYTADIPFKVTFFESPGDQYHDYQLIFYGEKVTRPSDPVRQGYIFRGWYTSQTYATIYNFANPVTSSFSLFAKWQLESENRWTITFDGGDEGSGYMTDYVQKGSLYTLPSPRYTAFYPPDFKEFDTWDAGAPGEKISVSKNITVHALWKPEPELIFTDDSSYLTGGHVTVDIDRMAQESYMLREARAEGSLEIVWLRNGYEIEGVTGNSLEITDDLLYSSIQMFLSYPNTTGSNIQLYSKSTTVYPGICTVHFDTPNNDVPDQYVVNGKTAYYPTTVPVREGYAFRGWYRNFWDDDRMDPFTFLHTPITDNTTFYARWWDLTEYSITVEPGVNGTVTVSHTQASEGTTVHVTAEPQVGYTVDKMIYIFNEKVSETIYDDEFSMPASDVTVYVTFKPILSDVTSILRLPTGLKVLEDEAFTGVTADAVVIPHSVTSIQGDPFSGSSVHVIFGYTGSAAQVYAFVFGYDFYALDGGV